MYTPSLNTSNRFTVILDITEIDLLLVFHRKAYLKFSSQLFRLERTNDGRGPLKSHDKLDEIKGLSHFHKSSIDILVDYRERIIDVPLKHMDPLELP